MVIGVAHEDALRLFKGIRPSEYADFEVRRGGTLPFESCLNGELPSESRDMTAFANLDKMTGLQPTASDIVPGNAETFALDIVCEENGFGFTIKDSSRG